MSILRAVEQRITMVRSTNTGITAIITPLGEIMVNGGLFHRQLFVHDVPIGASFSVYRLIGDLLAWICLGLSGLILLPPRLYSKLPWLN